MKEEERKAYKGLKKQGAFLLRSQRFGLVVISTELRILTVTLPILVTVTTSEYINRRQFVPTYYKGPNIKKLQTEFCVKHKIKSNQSDVIIFRRN
jgi:hypothetical protein